MINRHSQEPWRVEVLEGDKYHLPNGPIYMVLAQFGKYPSTVCVVEECNEVPEYINREADARRIAACVNACAGISTVTLENLGVGGLRNIAGGIK